MSRPELKRKVRCAVYCRKSSEEGLEQSFILDGRQPKGVRLAEMLGKGPLGWDQQRGAWGFA